MGHRKPLQPSMEDAAIFRQLELHYKTVKRPDDTWRGVAFDNQVRPMRMLRACHHHHKQEHRAYECAKELGREVAPERVAKDRALRASAEARERLRSGEPEYEPTEKQLRQRAAWAAGVRGAAYVRAKANELLRAHADCRKSKVVDKDGLREDEAFAIECPMCKVRVGVIVYFQVDEGQEE